MRIRKAHGLSGDDHIRCYGKLKGADDTKSMYRGNYRRR
jgi:hypothetical protein